MERLSRGPGAYVAIAALLLLLAGCGPGLPHSVVEGSLTKVGWGHDLTSLNAATRVGATQGNSEIAAVTRSQFARLADGGVTLDESFGSVTILDPDPSSFTVRYDLADNRWSDGINIDAADLLLAWAAGSNALAPEDLEFGADGPTYLPADGVWFDSLPGDLVESTALPEYDDFARRIDVAFDRPVRGWQTALEVAAPAHLVGQLALEVDDPMEAKQAVINAIRDHDVTALQSIAEVWNTGFDVPSTGEVPEELLVSSGPYQVAAIEQGGSGTERVRLTVNRAYAGAPTATYEHLELIVANPAEQLTEFGKGLDVVHLAPTEENWQQVRDLERLDHNVSTANDGTAWALVARADRGEFTARRARLAFLRAVPNNDLREAGAGAWREAHATTNSLLFSSTSRDYGIAVEDSGFREIFPRSVGSDADEARERAGVRRGTQVCVLYDKAEPFAVAAFAALGDAVAEAGWRVRDCGSGNLAGALENNDGWHAVLMKVPMPETPAEIAETWGGDTPLSGVTNEERDQLIEALAATADHYQARDLKVAIEASLMQDAVALPLAMNPVVTIADRDIENVRRPSGRYASLLSRVVDWRPAD